MNTILIQCPPLPEQRAIAAFLDHETAQIDALVAKKERLIELLQEKRTALISDAVTKGLDPDVLLKDSGVEWLGEIPAHWEIVPVYARYEVALGKNARCETNSRRLARKICKKCRCPVGFCEYARPAPDGLCSERT